MTSAPTPLPTRATADVADELQVTPRFVVTLAKRLGVGMWIGGRNGFRFTDDDVSALHTALRPAAPAPPRRRRRAS